MSALEILRKEDPRVLIEGLPTIPYPWDERIADIRASGMEFLKNVFTVPLFPLSIGYCEYFTSNYKGLTGSSDLLTSETIPNIIDKHFAESKEKIQIGEKLTYISNKVQEYAQETNLGKIDLYFHSNTEHLLHSQALQVKNKNIIEIGHVIFESSFEEIDFTMAHELMHIKHNDYLKELGFSCSKSILYVFFLLSLPWIYSIPLILLTNGVASLLFNAIRRKYEAEADKGALDFLQTNTGMIKFTSNALWRNLALKDLSIERLKKIYPDLSLEILDKAKSEITHIGNDRCDFDHPSYTERLALALAFVPKA